jgi:hypothetical protein
MPMYINDGGTWRTILQTYINDAGTWRPTIVSVNDAGTWRVVSVQITLQDTACNIVSTAPAAATASYSLRNTGDVFVNGGDAGHDWINPNAAAGNAYEAFFTVTGGTLTSGTTGTWLPLGTTRTWTLQRSGGSIGTSTASGTVQIRRASDGTFLDAATITFSAEVSPP